MQDEKDKIYSRLVADATLLALLGANVPFYNPNGSALTSNSIYPAGKANGSSVTPFITLQAGGQTMLGSQLYDEVYYIRVYDSIKRAYVSIQKAQERIKTILDDYELSLDNSRLVRAKYENTGPELVDESLRLNFMESQFRLLLL